MVAQHPNLVSVTVINTMMKMQLGKKNGLFLLIVCNPSQKSTKARIEGRGLQLETVEECC